MTLSTMTLVEQVSLVPPGYYRIQLPRQLVTVHGIMCLSIAGGTHPILARLVVLSP
jgi:hypothetical protein